MPDDLPATTAEPRPGVEVLDRYLALHSVVATAVAHVDGRRLVAGYDVAHALTPAEAEYLDDAAAGVRVEDAARALAVEQLAVLAWALDAGPEPPLDAPTDPNLVLGVADVVYTTSATPRTRGVGEIRRRHDLYAAMAWALRADPDLAVGAAPGPVDPYVVHQRHAALRWLLRLDDAP